MIKDIEFFIKKILFFEKFLLKKRLIRAINKGYEKELKIVEKYSDKNYFDNIWNSLILKYSKRAP